jgi:aspartate/methionine/tyrosine aminotransferase
MSPQRREIRSSYIEWARLRSKARFNLAMCDVSPVSISDLPVRMEDLEITGPSGYGYKPLIERLAARAAVEVDSVVHAQGTSMANHLAMAALIEPDDEVLIEEPGYEALISAALYLGAKVRRFSRRFEAGFQLDPREVERSITPRTRLIVVTNLHNPTGVRTPDSTLKLIGEIARSLGAHVLVDEVYLESCFDAPAQTAFHLGSNFLVTGSLTKAYGLSGLRCGWILAAPALAQRMWRLNDLFGIMGPHVAERLSVVALDNLPQITAKVKARLAVNRTILQKFLSSRKDLLAIRTEEGTVVFPLLSSGPADAFCQLLREKFDTSVVPGRFFDAPAHIRIGIGGETEDVREGLTRLGAALDELAVRR